MFKMFDKPRIHTVLLSVNLALLLLPIAGIWGFRLYETELIRRTEAELISQAILLKEMFLVEVERLALPEDERDKLLGPAIEPKFRRLHEIREGEFRKVYPRLDIYRERKRDPILIAETPQAISDPSFQKIGAELSRIIRNAQFNLLSGIRVVSSDGTVIASSIEVTGHNIRDREEVRRALAGEPLSIIRRRAGRELPTHSILSYGTGVIVFVAQPVVLNNHILGAVVASRTPMNLANAIYEHRHHLVRFFVILMIMVLIMTTLTAATIGGPIRRLAKMTTYDRKRGRGYKVEPIKRPGTAEVAALSEAFAKMSNSLHERADYTEGLVRSISHEFKTPIASINASVEILEDHLDTMTPQERKKFLSMIGKDSLRLQRLVERLLELARADAIMNPAGACNPSAVMEEIKADFSGQCKTIEIADLDPTLTLAMPHEAFYSAVSNLVANSISHGGPHVSVRITTKQDGEKCMISVSDDGPGIDPLDRAKIFEPFFTTARDKGGTGLGLSIVKSLVEAYGGKVLLAEPAHGARVEMTVPVNLKA